MTVRNESLGLPTGAAAEIDSYGRWSLNGPAWLTFSFFQYHVYLRIMITIGSVFEEIWSKMMHKSQPKWKYYFSCHFIAISAWLIMKSNYKNIPKKHRIDYWIGIGSATVSVSVIGTFIGFSFSEYLNKDMMMGLAILNPVYFLCMMVGASKTIPVTLSVLLGSILGPIIYLFSPEWSILLAGVIGGTIAYLVGEHSVS